MSFGSAKKEEKGMQPENHAATEVSAGHYPGGHVYVYAHDSLLGVREEEHVIQPKDHSTKGLIAGHYPGGHVDEDACGSFLGVRDEEHIRPSTGWPLPARPPPILSDDADLQDGSFLDASSSKEDPPGHGINFGRRGRRPQHQRK
jgi:hypothetical protein